MEGLADNLLTPSPLRFQGTHEAQGVLIRAGPGTGKTVSLHQLTRILAKRLLASANDSRTVPASRASPSSVDPGAPPLDSAIGLVPMLVSVQRLASYMKQRGGMGIDGADLLRAYIDTEFSGAERDLLAQAYQMRALVCCIDGVDEAANLKSRIEDLVVDQLAPMGVRVVVSSRPEGVRLERYASFIVMNLSPLDDAQQRAAISVQLKNSKEYEHLDALSRARRGVTGQGKATEGNGRRGSVLSATELATAAESHFEVILGHLKTSCPAGTDFDDEITRVLNLFEEASSVPVMLSMLVLCLDTLLPTTRLPTSRLDLYKTSVRAAISRRFANESDPAGAAHAAGCLLAKLCVANHLAQRREFTSVDVAKVFADAPEELALFQRFEGEAGGVPLLKILEVGEHSTTNADQASKYQMAHLSFQESFFAEALCAAEADASSATSSGLVNADIASNAKTTWSRGALRALNDRWLLNSFAICGKLLGPTVAEHLGSRMTELRFTQHQVKALIALEWEPLRCCRQPINKLFIPCGKDSDFTSMSSPGAKKLAQLLSDKNELTSLTSIEFGMPKSMEAPVAARISSAVAQRRSLRLFDTLQCAQFGDLTDADAVLIASTLRSCAQLSDEALIRDVCTARLAKAGGGSKAVINLTGGETSGGGDTNERTLAEALKQGGIQLSSMAKDMATHLMLAGFSASELRSGMRLSTPELADAGYPALEIAETLGGAITAQATLREMADNGLALELLATEAAGVGIEDLRKANCSGVPDEEQMRVAVNSSEIDLVQLEQAPKFELARKNLDDDDCSALIWAIVVQKCRNLEEISMTRNEAGSKTAAALAQFLRFNKTVGAIDLHENRISDAATTALMKALCFNSTLKTLRLSGNNITAQVVTTLCDRIASNSSLSFLTMEVGSGGETGMYLPPLKGLEPADQVQLAGRNFGPLSTMIIANLFTRFRPNVADFQIDRNPILREGAIVVGEMLRANDDIKSLDVRFCALGPGGASGLADALRHNTSVERVLALANDVRTM